MTEKPKKTTRKTPQKAKKLTKNGRPPRKLVELSDLLGTHELTKLARVTDTAVWQWRKRNKDFPKPVLELKMGPLYSKKEVRAWLLKRATRIKARLQVV
jgi:predicted DNA-binding transcriptional regulator AlpA